MKGNVDPSRSRDLGAVKGLEIEGPKCRFEVVFGLSAVGAKEAIAGAVKTLIEGYPAMRWRRWT